MPLPWEAVRLLAACTIHSISTLSDHTIKRRRDEAAQLSAAEAVARGGGGCILLERLLPELAYKLGRAPKYGA